MDIALTHSVLLEDIASQLETLVGNSEITLPDLVSPNQWQWFRTINTYLTCSIHISVRERNSKLLSPL